MKKKYLNLLCCGFVFILMQACSQPQAEEPQVAVTVNISDFKIAVLAIDENSTASTKASLEDAFPYISFAVFNNATGAKVYEFTKPTSDDLSKHFQMTLPYGAYTLVAVGYPTKNEVYCNIKSATEVDFKKDNVSEVFSASNTLELVSSVAKTISMELNRCVACMNFSSIDEIPNVYHDGQIEIVVRGAGKLLNPTTSLAAQCDSVKRVVMLTAGAKVSTSINAFLPADAYNAEVVIRVFNSSNACCFMRTLQEVPLQRNRKTLVSGELFSQGSSVQLTASTEWLPDTTYQY